MSVALSATIVSERLCGTLDSPTSASSPRRPPAARIARTSSSSELSFEGAAKSFNTCVS
jgi:hypothetical protein